MSWWSRRFLELLESFGLGSRLERGLSYARSGQVTELEVEPGIVLAKVQGSRYTPYRVRIRPPAFSEHQWRRAEKAIAAQAATVAKLLAGELPPEIEEVLAGTKLALLPSAYEELRATCSCPDAASPCKHTAAVYYVLAEHLDRDPFALLTLRGRDREELLEHLRARRAKAAGVKATGPVAPAGALTPRRARTPEGGSAPGAPDPPPLAEQLDGFWRAGAELSELAVSPLASEAPDAMLRQLGPAPVHVSERNLAELLAPAYVWLASAAERRALADR